MDIKVTVIKPQTVEVFDPNNKSLGFVNEYEFNDLRIQVATENISGYYVLFNGEKIQIEPSGKLFSWPVGFFDTIEQQLATLFKVS
jgi:predicted ATPase